VNNRRAATVLAVWILLGAACRGPGEKGTPVLDLSHYCTKVSVEADAEISLYDDGMFRFRISHLEGDRFPNRYEIPFVIGRLENWPPVAYREWKDDAYHYIETAVLRIRVDRKTLDWQVFVPGRENRIYPSEGPIHGMFRDGYTVFDSASAFDEPNHNSRFAHWFFNPGTGRYVDTHLDGDLIFDRYFIFGPEYEKLFFQLNRLIGPEPLLPRKAYGFFQTQHLACEGTQEMLMEVARKFRERDIPCDYLIVDFEWGDGCDGDREVKWGSRLDWSSHYTSPLSPEEMIDRLRSMHFDVMLIHHSAPDFPNRLDQGWTESLVDEKTWWDQLRSKLDIGVRGTWQDTRRNDLTDSVIWNGLRDYYGTSQRVLFMGCRKMQEINPWETMRNTIPVNQVIGARRYPFDWTGDADYTWAELKWQIGAMTNRHGSMKGVTYITNDAYGADWKIQARWNQFIDFNTVSRSHNLKPWAGDSELEEWKQKIKIAREKTTPVGETLRMPESGAEETAETSIRRHRKLRYRLLPYIYSQAYVNHLTGLPVCRPMLLAFPDDPACSADQWPYQYLFGPDLLAAPVYADTASWEIYLPAGAKWIDYWNHEVYEGGKTILYDASNINRLPLFVRSGAVIPMRPDSGWIDPAIPDDPLTLDVYPLGNRSYDLYEDDGVTTDYQRGHYARTRILSLRLGTEGLRIRLEKAVGDYARRPRFRRIVFKINLWEAEPLTVNLGRRRLPKRIGAAWSMNEENGWKYDPTARILWISAECDVTRDSEIAVGGKNRSQ